MFIALATTFTVTAQEEEIPEIKEFNRPSNSSGIKQADKVVEAAYNFYDKVIETRKKGDENGYQEEGMSIFRFEKEGGKLVMETAKLTEGGLKGGFVNKKKAQLNLGKATLAVNHALKQIKYMKSQFTPEEQAELESALKAEEGEDSGQ